MVGATGVADHPPKHGGSRKGAGRPKSADRKDGSIRIDRTVLSKIQWVALRRHITVGQYATELLRTQVERDFLKETKKLQDGAE